MSFWKVSKDNKVEQIATTKLKTEHLLEKNLEDWILAEPEILGEPLLVIGRQITIPELRDRLDILALDPNGNAVIIELKRGRMSDPIDMQALRYASYISKWDFEDFENLAKSHLGNEEDFNFNELFEEFCTREGIEEIPDINSNQRIIVAGSEVKDKLGSVALWLFEHSIDIKVIEIDSYKDNDSLIIQPRTIIPLAVNKFSEVGKTSKGDFSKPWISAGKIWHLEKKMRPGTKDTFLQLDAIIKENLPVEGPRFDQKHYISYQHRNQNWLVIRTHANILVLHISIKPKSMVKTEVARQLGIVEFDSGDSLSEKLNLPSSIDIKNRNEFTDRIILRIKNDFDLMKPSFLSFLKEALKNAPRE